MVEKNKYVRMLQTFRPAQTVFETGIGTGSLGTKINGGAHPQQMTLKTKLAKGAEMMKALREATHASLERNRVAVAQQLAAAKLQGKTGEGEDRQDDQSEDQDDGSEGSDSDSDGDGNSSADSDEDEDEDSAEDTGSDDDEGYPEVDEYSEAEAEGDLSFVTARSGPHGGAVSRRPSAAAELLKSATIVNRAAAPSKVRLSMTEKKKLKKKGLSQEEIRAVALRKAAAEHAQEASGLDVTDDSAPQKKHKNKAGGAMPAGLSDVFRDRKHYMAYGDEDAAQSFAEESMQPQSHLRSSESMSEYSTIIPFNNSVPFLCLMSTCCVNLFGLIFVSVSVSALFLSE